MANELPDYLNATVKLEKFQIKATEDYWGDEPWMINVFFRVDGTNSVLSDEFQLVSTPTVHRSAGAHENLGVSDVDSSSSKWHPVPANVGTWNVGQFRRIRLPNPCDALPAPVGLGTIGMVSILFDEDGLTDSSAVAGADQAVKSVRAVVTEVANSLSLENPDVSDDTLKDYEDRIGDEIKKAIKDDLGFWGKIGTLGDKDDKLGSHVLLWKFDDLRKALHVPLELKFTEDDAHYVFVGSVTAQLPS